MQVFTTSKGLRIESNLSNADAVAIARRIGSDFSRSLVASWDAGRATESQLAWIHKIALDASKPAPAAPAALETLTGAFEFLNSCRLKTGACVTFESAMGIIQIKKAGQNSKYAGCFWVTDGRPYGENTLFGRIDLQGNFIPGRDCTDGIKGVLREFDSNPSKYAADYGRRTGKCCFCHAELTDEVSIQFGYGPICAKNYGLPHGKRAAAKMLCAAV